MKKFHISMLGAALFAITVGAHAQDDRTKALSMMTRDFHVKGIATMDRLTEDGVQALCNRSANNPPKEVAERLEHDQVEAIRYPADGKYLGDWKSGEKIAQNGRGMTWNDKANQNNGGSCYNCHQIGPKETSYGSVGPSLYHFGKTRGYGAPIQKYVYGKIYNAKAFNLCSAMPRFGHFGTLTEKQIKDLAALLLDPNSPVNK